MTQQPQQPQNTEKEAKTGEKVQSPINDHDNFNSFVSEGLRIGAHVVASKSHGKTRLLFTVASELMKQENVRVIAFDGSLAWVFGMSKIPVFTISEKDIIQAKRCNVDTIEKFSLQNENLVKLALKTHKDILFNLKPRSASKRGYFTRYVVNLLDEQQRQEKIRSPNHDNKQAIAFFIEEAQNSFSSRNSASNENETFLTVFNEARNQKQGFFTASQRLTDFSKTIRSKQIACIGKLSSEDITPSLRRLEKMHGLDFCNMKPKHWFYEGSTFESPEFKQNGKPYCINAEIKKAWLDSLPKHKTLKEKIASWLKPFFVDNRDAQTLTNLDDSEDSESREDSESDGLMDDDDILFPPEF